MRGKTVSGNRVLRLLVSAAVAVAVVGLTAGCGPKAAASAVASGTPSASASAGAGCQQVGTVNFDKTKFVLHAGLAFGAFHHFIYAPFKAGSFTSGAKGRTSALVKAGLAGLFTAHEMSVAKTDAESSPTLCKLVAPFDQASSAIGGLVSKIKNGSASSSDLDKLNGQVNTLQSSAAADGDAAPDQIPSATQLATGS
ncbi:MAG: hypothetical protein JWR81_4254 [Pseudonocardia sp.]|jgi:hypothetical protein|nr:hypothetical protein [Pseudonocardia sp.]MDT7617026.1 hypothetical protein [Pseudonocardiales bacterium]